MVGKGLAVDDLERHIEAIQCYNTALQIDPNLALAWDNKTWALCNLEKYDESIQCSDKAIQIDPNFASAWHRKGCTLGIFCCIATFYIEWNRSIVPNSIPVYGSFPTTHALCPGGI